MGTISDQISEHWDQLTAPHNALISLKDLVCKIGQAQNKNPPIIVKKKLLLAAGEHAVADSGISAYPKAVTKQMVANVKAGKAMINQLCRINGAQIELVDCCEFGSTNHIAHNDAMSPEQFKYAYDLGWSKIAGDEDIIALGEMGIGNTTIAAAICHALYGGDSQSWTGRGTGIDETSWRIKCEIVAAAAVRNNGISGIELLKNCGGFEFVALAAGVEKAINHQIPVIIDGFATTAVIAAMASSNKEILNYCIAGHQSREPGHNLVLKQLGLNPVIKLDMALGEGSGAVMAIPIIEAALAIYAGTATFAEAMVDNK